MALGTAALVLACHSRYRVFRWLSALLSMGVITLGLLTLAARENIQCKLMLADRDIKIMADHDKIEQALMNLTNNAVDAMPDGGILTIRTDVIRMDREMTNSYGLEKSGAYGVITVSDTGDFLI